MIEIDIPTAAILFSMQRPLFGLRRKITSDPFDFGPDDTIGCCVKSVDAGANQQFGKFVGKMNTGYTIVVYDLENNITGGQQFETLEEMHSIWQVD